MGLRDDIKQLNAETKQKWQQEKERIKREEEERKQDKAETEAIKERTHHERVKDIDGFYLTKKRFIQEDQAGLQITWALTRFAFGIMGITGYVMAFSVILFTLGLATPLVIPLIVGSKGFMDIAAGKRAADCPNCSKKNYVDAQQTVFTCKKCHERITIIWE